MTVRLSGIAFLFLSAVYYSFILIKTEKQKLTQLEDFRALVLHIKRNIEAYMTPVDEIILNFQEHSREFYEFMEMAKKHGLYYASEHYPMLQKNEVNRTLRTFAKKIGSGYKDEELNLCQYTYATLAECFEKEKAEFMKKAKMYKTLPIMFAISAALLLY